MRLAQTKNRVLGTLLIGSVVVILLGGGLSERLRHGAWPALAPVGDGATYLTTFLQRQARDLTAEGLTGAEARKLREENKELRGQVFRLEADLLRRMRQQRAIDSIAGRLPSGFPCRLIAARVVGQDSLPYGSTRVLNVGGQGKAAPGQYVTTRRLFTDRSKALPEDYAVVGLTALVGRLISTGAFTARMQLVTDKNFKVLGGIRRIINPRNPRQITLYGPRGGRLVTITPATSRILVPVECQGDGKDGLIVKQVKEQHNVRVGDWLMTSDKEAFFPARERIGTVTHVEPEPDAPGFVRLKVRPHADLGALQEVYIVYPLGDHSAGGGS